jgi:hypothetical protein
MSDEALFLLFAIPVSALLIWIVVLAFRRPASATVVKELCTSCGSVVEAQYREKGSLGTEIILWLMGILPGIAYSVWRRSSSHWACPECSSTGLIPVDSPRAIEIQRRVAAAR